MSDSRRLSVVLPAHNEEQILRRSVNNIVVGLRSRGIDSEVLIVQNGSVDGTAAIADELADENREVRVVTLSLGDYGNALREGLLAANGEVVVVFDVDHYELAFLERALPRCDAGADIVLATKRSDQSHDTRAWHRLLITAMFTRALHLLFGLHASDTHGIKALRMASMRPLAEASRSRRDLYDTELVLRAERSGARVEETWTQVIEQRRPRLSIFWRVARTLCDLLTLRIRLWREP